MQCFSKYIQKYCIIKSATLNCLNYPVFGNKFNILIPSLKKQKEVEIKVKKLNLTIKKLKETFNKLNKLSKKIKLFFPIIVAYGFKNLNKINYKEYKLKDVLDNLYVGKTPSTKNSKYWDNKNGFNWLTIRDISKKKQNYWSKNYKISNRRM